MLTSK